MKKKILPDEIQLIIEEVKQKEHEEDVQEARELVQLVRTLRANSSDYWDVKKEDKIDVFDPTLSYEITGYRPITQTQGLDFNPEWFIETRKVFEKTGKYCPYLPGSKRYDEFWKELYIRCKYGMTVNGYTITGDNYFFLNFYQLPIVDENKASGSGLNRGFPKFFESHYRFFHYLQLARETHKHAALMKARSIGFSEINASLSARMYTVVRNSRTMITCFNDNFLKGTFSKADGALTFLNSSTLGGMFLPRLTDKELEKKSGYQEKVNGLFEDFGFKSTIIGVNGNKPSNIRGDRVDLLIFDEAGCHAPGTLVIMYDGTLKNVEDIVIGDVLMGDDCTPRNVIELHSGEQQMYKIIPNVGDELIVNANHILYGKHRNYSKKTYEEFTMKTEDYYNMVTENPRKKDGYKLIHSDKIEFSYKEIPIDPYILGFWLGDGNSDKARFTTEDLEIIDYLIEYGNNHNYNVKVTDCENTKKCKHIYYASNTTKNEFHEKLRNLNILNNKHIPNCYLYNSKNVLLELLAGLIDSDGTYNKDKYTVEFTQCEERKHLVDLVEYICHLLGMKVSRDVRVSKDRKLNGKILKGGINQYRLKILFGHSQIPCKLPRKQTVDRDNTKAKSLLDRLDSPFKIEKLGIGKYYGFSLDGNQLFLLKDFTVCHNSWPNLTTAIVQGQELCEVQGVPRGTMLFGGTGGDHGAPLEGLKKIYYHPRAFKVLPYRHNYTQTGEYEETGFFIPYFVQSLRSEFMDHRGVCDIERYKKELQEERDNLLAVPEEYYKKCAERCWFAEEAFNLEGVNKFNKVLISEQLAEIRLHKRGPRPEAGYIDYFYKNGKHTIDNIDGFKWIPNQNGKVQILEHPVWSDLYKENIEKQRLKAEEKGEEFEVSVYNEMNDLYVAGIDGIDIGANQTSDKTKDPSDFCIVILRRAHGLKDPQIVAMYKDRPGNIREAYKISMCLARYYNCRINIEATRVGMITWARENKCLQYFMKRPRATLTDIKYGTTKQYGTPATKTVIELHTDLTADFVEDYCHTIWFEEILQQLTSYNDENKGKFDIVAAMGMVFLADQELSGRLPTNVVKEVELFEDFGYYWDEYGRKKFGVIPKKTVIEVNINKERYYDPYRFETSDTRFYDGIIQGGIRWGY